MKDSVVRNSNRCSEVIEAASKAGYVLITTDKRMEAVWTDDIIFHKAKIILLTDEDGVPFTGHPLSSSGNLPGNASCLTI